MYSNSVSSAASGFSSFFVVQDICFPFMSYVSSPSYWETCKSVCNPMTGEELCVSVHIAQSMIVSFHLKDVALRQNT